MLSVLYHCHRGSLPPKMLPRYGSIINFFGSLLAMEKERGIVDPSCEVFSPGSGFICVNSSCDITERKQQRGQRHRRRYLKINIWEMVTML